MGFQDKSMERILEFRERKTTLVFISHGLDAIKKLCDRTIWLEQGQIKLDGPTDEVVQAYQSSRLHTPEST
jgi:teichoic acid transport system ATP-binding protein